MNIYRNVFLKNLCIIVHTSQYFFLENENFLHPIMNNSKFVEIKKNI